MKKVQVTVTSKIVGTGYIYPYDRGMRTSELDIYEVPLYEVRVDPTDKFKAVRFGMVPISPVAAVRTCDKGLNKQHIYFPTWVPGYSPHSFPGVGRRGAWRIREGAQFLIHEGSDIKEGQVGGSLGCIEIVGASEWNRFLTTIEGRCGGRCAQISATRSLKLTIEATRYPKARLRARLPMSH